MRPSKESEDGDCEVQIIGTSGGDPDLPHNRQDCPKHKFTHLRSSRSSFCTACFCYVCDIPAKDCKLWATHCHAADVGPSAYHWNEQRRAAKLKRARENAPAPPPDHIVFEGLPVRPDMTYAEFHAWIRENNLPSGGHGLSRGCDCGECSDEYNSGYDSGYDYGNYGVYGYRTAPSSYDRYTKAASEAAKKEELEAAEEMIPQPPDDHCKCRFCQILKAFYAARLLDLGCDLDLSQHFSTVTPSEMACMPILRIPSTMREHLEAAAIPISHPPALLLLVKKNISSSRTQRSKPRTPAQIALLKTSEEAKLKLAFKQVKGGDSWHCSFPSNVANLSSLRVPRPPECIYLGTIKLPCSLLFGLEKTVTPMNPNRHEMVEHYIGLGTPILEGLIEMAHRSFVYPYGPQGLRLCTQCDDDSAFARGLFDESHRAKTIHVEFLRFGQLEGNPSRNLFEMHMAVWITPNLFRSDKNSKSFVTHASFDYSELLGRTVLKGVDLDHSDPTWWEDSVVHNFTPSRKGWGGHASVDTSLVGLIKTVRREASLPLDFESRMQVRCILSSVSGLMEGLENLGHAAVEEQPEELTVTLYEHQRQNLRWMVQQETVVESAHAHLWAEVPLAPVPGSIDSAPGKQQQKRLWYSPALNSFVAGNESENPVAGEPKGGFLADAMGLGKTVCTLGLHLLNPAPKIAEDHSKADVEEAWGPTVTLPPCVPAAHYDAYMDKMGRVRSNGTLVVCAVSLVGQWVNEAKRLCGDKLSIYPYHGANRKRDPEALAKYDIVVTTYGVVAADMNTADKHTFKRGQVHVPPLFQIEFWRVVLDESHYIRNTSVKNAVSVKHLIANRRWMMSGTPCNNSLSDMTSQLHFLGLKVYSHNDAAYSNPEAGSRSLTLLRRILMRHANAQKLDGKENILGLPPMTTELVPVAFTPEEKAAYAALESRLQITWREIRSDMRGKAGSHTFKALTALARLRQACSGGQSLHVTEGGEAFASDALCSICENLLGDSGVEIKTCHHAFHEDCIRSHIVRSAENKRGALCPQCKKKAALEDLCEVGTSSALGHPAAGGGGTLPSAAPQITAHHGTVMKSKLDELVRRLKLVRLKDPQAKSLVFSQYAPTLKYLETELKRAGFDHRTLKGDMTRTARTRALEEFQTSPPTTIFLLSLRAGAVGINLTAANHVFLLEPSLNQATEQQAIGRVHRCGQLRPVSVHRLYHSSSVESRIVCRQERKLAAQSMEASEAEDAVALIEQGGKREYGTGVAASEQIGSISKDVAKDIRIEEWNELFGVANEVHEEQRLNQYVRAPKKFKKRRQRSMYVPDPDDCVIS
jgi:SNF2 family DNA or RNA helicase